MNNEVNTLFRSYNDLDLVKAENIVLESETKLDDKERKILMGLTQTANNIKPQ